MQRNVLLIAFHYPPCAVSSGTQRTLAFSRDLPAHGWNPTVLTVEPGAYEKIDPERLHDVPRSTTVVRTRALDVARDLAFRGRYLRRLAVPDRWRFWTITAVPTALRLLEQGRFDAIWSTYPIATAHRIGAKLASRTGVPWIADFRDPMVEVVAETGEAWPRDARVRKSWLEIEGRAAAQASALVFCTSAARGIVLERYGEALRSRCRVIPNGFDEQAFRDIESLPPARSAGRRVLLHSGTIYAGPDRDPSALFAALGQLKAAGVVSRDRFELRLRDPSSPQRFEESARAAGVADLVSILPALSYREALQEMLAADALLLLQGVTSNPAVPAKLYEYLRARRPILGLVHPDGETAATLRSLQIDSTAPLTDQARITALLERWLGDKGELEAALPPATRIVQYSRAHRAAELAALLDAVASTRAPRTV